jgi:quercetin dioxygenase-like cupin family protein
MADCSWNAKCRKITIRCVEPPTRGCDQAHPMARGKFQEKEQAVTAVQPLEHVSFEKPDEVREGANWRMELVNLAGGAQVGRVTLQPGWKWSEHVKPVAGTELCMAPHQQYQVAGRIHLVLQDGTELDAGPGEVLSIPPGHDAWVVGDEPVVGIDWQGASVWAQRNPS